MRKTESKKVVSDNMYELNAVLKFPAITVGLALDGV